MVTIKEKVSVAGIRPEILLAIQVADAVYSKQGIDCTITSGTDGVHSENSLHYKGMAVDLRSRYLSTASLAGVVANIKQALGRQYDVVVETDHIHIEFDPK